MSTYGSLMAASARQAPQMGQRGAAAIMTAGFMLLGVLCLALVVDTGRLYMEKRSLQRIADMAAMEAASRLGCSPDGNGVKQAQRYAQESVARHHFTGTVVARCGEATPVNGEYIPRTGFTVGDGLVVEVEVQRSVPASLIVGGLFRDPVTLRAVAAARRGGLPLAQLNIRSTLATVDPSQSALLNTVVGGLLGGSLNLSAGGWNGLLGADVNLLKYLDALAIDLGLSAGDYEGVLGTNVSVGQLLDVAAEALTRGAGQGSTANINAAIAALDLLKLAIPGQTPLVQLGDILGIQTGSDQAGLDTGINLFQLVQGTIQLANGQSAVAGSLPINIPGVAGVSIQFKILEPGQPSAIGDPRRAKAAPYGDDRIYVRTSQVRALVSLNLPIAGNALTALEGLLNSSVVSGITTAVNDVLSLNLLGVLSSLSCLIACDIQRDVVDIKVLPSPRLDLNIDAGGGHAFLTDYSCNSGAKSLTAQTQTATASIRLGQIGNSAAEAAQQVFSSHTAPTVKPVPLLDIGSKRIRYQCTLLLLCSTQWRKSDGTWSSNQAQAARTAYAGGGIALKLESGPGSNALAGANSPLLFPVAPAALPDVGYVDPVTGAPTHAWASLSSSSVVNSLSGFLAAPQLEIFRPQGSSLGSGLGNVLSLVGSVANTLVSTLQSTISGVLSPILDPLVNNLLKLLGVGLNNIEVGANLTCASNEGVKLLY